MYHDQTINWREFSYTTFVTVKGPKGTSATLATDEAANITHSGQQKNPIVTTSVDSSGAEIKLTFWEQIKSFFSPLVKPNSDGNIVVGKSVGPVGAEVEIDPSAPIKISPTLNPRNALNRRECAAGLKTDGC